MTQFSNQVNVRLVSQFNSNILMEGILTFLHILTYFNGTAIYSTSITSIVCKFQFESNWFWICYVIIWFIVTNFVMFLNNYCFIKLYIGITASIFLALDTWYVYFTYLVDKLNIVFRCYLFISSISYYCCCVCPLSNNCYSFVISINASR